MIFNKWPVLLNLDQKNKYAFIQANPMKALNNLWRLEGHTMIITDFTFIND